MNDIIWWIVIGVMVIFIGLAFIWLGLAIWKKEKIDLIIRHHMEKVSSGDKQAYCKLCGIGMLIIGTGFAVSGILMSLTGRLLSWTPMTIGLAAGIMLLIIAVKKYNR